MQAFDYDLEAETLRQVIVPYEHEHDTDPCSAPWSEEHTLPSAPIPETQITVLDSFKPPRLPIILPQAMVDLEPLNREINRVTRVTYISLGLSLGTVALEIIFRVFGM